MKRYVALTTLLLLSAFCAAAPHGHLDELNDGLSKFLSYKLMHGQEITYCLAEPEAHAHAGPQELDLHIRTALNEWTRGTAFRIRAAGRAEEFADLLPRLENVRFKKNSACDLTHHNGFTALHPNYAHGPQAHVTFIVSDKYCGEFFQKNTSFFISDYQDAAPFICLLQNYTSLAEPAGNGAQSAAMTDADKNILQNVSSVLDKAASGRYTRQDQQTLWKANRLFSYDRPTYFSVFAHEIGHAMGLSDDYTAVGEDPLYSSVLPAEGIMRRAYEPIGCAETDGLITLLDRAAGKQRTFDSFCKDGIRFKNGVQQVTQNTPAKLVLRPGVTELISLRPDSSETKTYLSELLEEENALGTATLDILQRLPAAFSASLKDEPVHVYSRGAAHAGKRQGRWELVILRANRALTAYVAYSPEGKIVSVTPIRANTSRALLHANRLQNARQLNVTKVQDELKTLHP